MNEADRSTESLRSQAEEIRESLPEELAEATITCPLCESPTPGRGVQAEEVPLTEGRRWTVVFTCPTCGLNTTFDQESFALKDASAWEAPAWAERLRGFAGGAEEEVVPQQERVLPRQMIGIAVFGFVAWMLLTGNLSVPNLVWGSVVSLVVARLSYRLVAMEIPWRILRARRWVHFAVLLLEFGRQLIVQNVKLSVRVLRPSLPVRPGIVAVPTELEGDFELALLGSLLSLTPDTVAMDIDQEEGIVYLHWIDVETTDPQEAKEMLFGRLEDRIRRWLE